MLSRARLALLTLTHVVDDLYPGVIPALLPFLVAEKNYSYAAVSGIALAATFLSSLAQPVFGLITDKHRLEWLVWAGMLTAGVGVSLVGVVDTYVLICVAVALSGLGVAAYHPEAARSARLAAGASAQGMSWFSVGGNVGLALGPLFVVAVLGSTGLSGTPLLVIPAVLVALLVIGSRAVARSRTPAGPAKPVPAGPARSNDWPAFRRLTTVVIVRSVGYSGVTSFLALYVVDQFDTSEATGSAALSAVTGAGVVGTVLGGWMADRIGRVTTLRISYVIAPLALGLMLLAPNLSLLIAGSVLFGLASFIPFSVQMTLGQEYLPRRVGTASGVTVGMAITAGGLFTPVIGLLADAYGIRLALSTLLVFLVLTWVLSLRLRDRDPDDEPVPVADAAAPAV